MMIDQNLKTLYERPPYRMIGMEGLFAYQMFVQRQYVMPQAAHYVPDSTLFKTGT